MIWGLLLCIGMLSSALVCVSQYPRWDPGWVVGHLGGVLYMFITLLFLLPLPTH